jgi:hypothetical protein
MTVRNSAIVECSTRLASPETAASPPCDNAIGSNKPGSRNRNIHRRQILGQLPHLPREHLGETIMILGVVYAGPGHLDTSPVSLLAYIARRLGKLRLKRVADAT